MWTKIPITIAIAPPSHFLLPCFPQKEKTFLEKPLRKRRKARYGCTYILWNILKQHQYVACCSCNCLSFMKSSYITYLSIMTGSDGVSLRFPQLFLSQHRLQERKKWWDIHIQIWRRKSFTGFLPKVRKQIKEYITQ